MLFYEPGRYNPPAMIRRQFFPSDIHTPDEHPFDPSEFERILSKYFKTVDITGHCVVSNLIPVVAKYVPVDIPTTVTERIYDFEQSVIDRLGYRFAWILTGVASRPHSQF